MKVNRIQPRWTADVTLAQDEVSVLLALLAAGTKDLSGDSSQAWLRSMEDSRVTDLINNLRNEFIGLAEDAERERW